MMFDQARLRLTLLYSAVFLACFWVFSFGLYAYTERAFEIEIGEAMLPQPGALADPGETVTDINETALDRLYFILLLLNGLLLFIVPAVSWGLTGKALEPVRLAHEMQRQFVSDAAHELRTPLTIIRGEMEMALNQQRSGAEYRAVIKSSREEIIRLSDLAARLLLLARHDGGEDRLGLERVDLTDLLSRVLAAHRAPLREKRLALTFTPPEDQATVQGEAVLLTQLFANLVDNAIKYTPEGGRIAVGIAVAGDKVRTEIADTGIGIAPELHEKIFARFTRADASRGETRGYGLGLAISRAIAGRHGGSIAVASVPQQGSRFTVTLPLA